MPGHTVNQVYICLFLDQLWYYLSMRANSGQCELVCSKVGWYLPHSLLSHLTDVSRKPPKEQNPLNFHGQQNSTETRVKDTCSFEVKIKGRCYSQEQTQRQFLHSAMTFQPVSESTHSLHVTNEKSRGRRQRLHCKFYNTTGGSLSGRYKEFFIPCSFGLSSNVSIPNCRFRSDS